MAGTFQLDIRSIRTACCHPLRTHPYSRAYAIFYMFLLSQTTVKKNIKKEEAEELKLKLEAVGGTVEIV